MRVLVAPDSFKGSLTAAQVAASIELGLKRVRPDMEVIKVPIADGGEGTVEALVAATNGRVKEAVVTGPMGKPVTAVYGLSADKGTGFIEMAAASGLPLVPADRRNPMMTNTYGTGELIRAVLDCGCRRITMGIGGSATVDGGLGMAQALGALFYDNDGRLLGLGGKELTRLASIDLTAMDARLRDVDLVVACDVTNPLYGPNGAACVYGPQKGATPDMVVELDRGLGNLASLVEKQLGLDVCNLPGAGAAGGLGAALVAFCGARLARGIDMVIEVCRLREIMPGVDLVITGEGRTDYQTVHGKAPIGIAALAKEFHRPVVCLSGSLGPGFAKVYEHGINAAFSIVPGPVTLEEAMSGAAEYLADCAESLLRLFTLGMGIRARGLPPLTGFRDA